MDQFQYLTMLLDRIYSLIAWQYIRTDQLEQTLSGVQAELKRIASLPNQHIEKIDYNFEHLKIEKLDGTLIIGLAPSDTGMIEQMDAGGQLSEDIKLGNSTSQQPQHPFAPVQDPIHDYIHYTVPDLLDDCARDQQREPLTHEQKEEIRADLLRQTDERIRLYMQHYGKGGELPLDAIEPVVLEQVKQDIAAALPLYMDHYREDCPYERTDSSGSDE